MEFLLSCLISIFIAILLSWLTIRFADWNFEQRNLVKNKLINITFNFKPITEALEAVSLIFSNPELIKELIEARQEFEKQERWRNDPLQIKKRFLDPIVDFFRKRKKINRVEFLIHNDRGHAPTIDNTPVGYGLEGLFSLPLKSFEKELRERRFSSNELEALRKTFIRDCHLGAFAHTSAHDESPGSHPDNSHHEPSMNAPSSET
jgi:hypothetical protein